MKVETPLKSQSPQKHVIQCKKYGDTLKMCFSEFGSKSIKKEKKTKKTFLNIIFHPFAAPTLLGRFVPSLASRVT